MFEQVLATFINGVSAGAWVFGAALFVIVGLMLISIPLKLIGGSRKDGKE